MFSFRINSLASAVIEPVAVATTIIESEIHENNNPSQGIQPYAKKIEIHELQNPFAMESVSRRTGKSISDSRLLEVASVADEAQIQRTKSDGHLQIGNVSCSIKAMPMRSVLFVNEIDPKSESSNTSVHDYENMVVLNVNRTDWGIRHWKSYSDIETSFHDNSVCKVYSFTCII